MRKVITRAKQPQRGDKRHSVRNTLSFVQSISPTRCAAASTRAAAQITFVFTSGRVGRVRPRARAARPSSFKAHPQMLRKLHHDGHDTRAAVSLSLDKNIQHTVRNTKFVPTQFKAFWLSHGKTFGCYKLGSCPSLADFTSSFDHLISVGELRGRCRPKYLPL